MNRNSSVKTIDAPEFIDITPVNDKISKAVVKVMYVGRNRNGSVIDEDVAREMANSLPGTPIVAVWNDSKGDFSDHGEVVTIDSDGIHFECKTVPYGFVPTDAKVWFQDFMDGMPDDARVEHKYLMTEAYLWTGQYPEVMDVITRGGKGQSMEIDVNDGEWAADPTTGVDLFIINDATFSKLCILGDDVEPCFEGASIEPDSHKFSEESDDMRFRRQLHDMVKEIRFALAGDDVAEGGLDMKNVNNAPVGEVVDDKHEDFAKQDAMAKAPVDDGTIAASFTEETIDDESRDVVDAVVGDDGDVPGNIGDDNDFGETFAMVSAENDELRNQLASLNEELESLREFKENVERGEKMKVVDRYFMLDDDDKSDVVAHIDEYTLGEVEEKLALAYVRKNVSFDSVSAPANVATFAYDVDASIDKVAKPVSALQEAMRAYKSEL